MEKVTGDKVQRYADKETAVRRNDRPFGPDGAFVGVRAESKHARQRNRHKGQQVIEQGAERGKDVGVLDQLQECIGGRYDQTFAKAEVVAVQ